MKMKSLKFMLLSAFVMLGSSAFAIDVKNGNIGYNTAGGGDGSTKALAITLNVSAAYAEDNLEIPSEFTKVDEMENTKYYKVVGFTDTWTNEGEAGIKNVKTSLKNLTIDAANMANLTNAFVGLEKLATLTVKCDVDGGFTTIDEIVKNLTIKGELVTLDIENLTKVTDGLTATYVLSKDAGFTKLASVKLPKNVTALPADFLNGTPITAITLPTSLTTVGSRAFKDCAELTAIDLTKVTSVGANAFDGCKKITELEIPATLLGADIAADAFANMDGLTTLTIKTASVPAVFTGTTTAVTTLNLQGVETIADDAFVGMTITKIDLSKCPNLTTAANKFKAGVKLNKVKLAGSKVKLSDIDLDASAESLKSITLSATAEAYMIPNNRFENFSKLTSITIPYDGENGKGVYAIGSEAFKGSALTTISIADGIFVGESAFEECAALASAEIGDDVTISNGAFKGCSALATLTFGEADEDANSITIGDNAFEGTALEAVNLPANVTSIGVGAFNDCAALKTFVAANLQVIPAAFEECNKLKAVVLPKTVEVINDYAFAGLPKLASVTFKHEGADDAESAVMTKIGEGAFEDCVALTAIDLSKTQLDDLSNDNVFKGCIALATITLPEEMDDLDGDNIFEGTIIETLDASMVDGYVANIFGTDNDEATNNSLKVLKLGNATLQEREDVAVPTYFGAFENCKKLKTVVLGAATVGSYAFANCDKLATVTTEAAAATSIDESAFDHCTALTTFTYKPEDNLTLGHVDERAFTGCTPYVLFDTNNFWVDNNQKAPLNTTYGAELVATSVTTVQDKANANQFVNKFSSDHYNVIFNAEDVKIYSVYVDGETAYFQACRTYNGKYFVEAGEHVILKTTEAKEVNFTIDSYAGAGAWVDDDAPAMGKSSVAFDDIECLYDEDGELSDIQALLGMGAGDYLYRLTNTASIGFGFTAYTGATVKAGQFFITTTKKPANADRLNIVWLDEDGNVEGEATAIKKIDSADANNGAIYNMQGVRVENAQKGIYIQNGKKFVVK